MKQTTSVSSAAELFRTAAKRKGDGVGLPVATDHALHAEMCKAVAILNASEEGREALKRLAEDPSPHVRSWAAAELLSQGDVSVVPLLEQIASERGLLSLGPQMVLQEYRAGRLRSPFPPPAP